MTRHHIFARESKSICDVLNCSILKENRLALQGLSTLEYKVRFISDFILAKSCPLRKRLFDRQATNHSLFCVKVPLGVCIIWNALGHNRLHGNNLYFTYLHCCNVRFGLCMSWTLSWCCTFFYSDSRVCIYFYGDSLFD